MDETRENERWSWLVGLVVGVAVLALLVAAYEIGYSRGRGGGGTAATAPASSEKSAGGGAAGGGAVAAGPGKALFAESCGTCHTISAAGTSGTVGPNLDELKPDAKRVLAALKNGGTGSGAMPVNLVSGKEARQVADFVAQATGGG